MDKQQRRRYTLAAAHRTQLAVFGDTCVFERLGENKHAAGESVAFKSFFICRSCLSLVHTADGSATPVVPTRLVYAGAVGEKSNCSRRHRAECLLTRPGFYREWTSDYHVL